MGKRLSRFFRSRLRFLLVLALALTEHAAVGLRRSA